MFVCLWFPFSCFPKDHISENLQILQIWICSPVHVVLEGGKYLKRLHFIPKQLKYLKPFIPKQLKLPNPPLSKQFLHFILAVTTSNTQRFKQFKLYLFADTTNKNLFLAIKSDSIAMNFKQLVNSVTFLLCSIYYNM